MHEKVEMDQHPALTQDGLGETALLSVTTDSIHAIAQQQAPHKIFLWDPTGVYQNYCFLNPPFGHFIPPSSLLGATIHEVHSRANSRLLTQTISRVMKYQVQQTIALIFHRHESVYEATVQCLPTANEQIIGLVRDRLLQGTSVGPSLAASAPVTWGQAYEHALTPREQAVFARLHLQPSTPCLAEGTAFGPSKQVYARQGLTNQAIADELGISLRTVKEHVTNIYRKLQIVSRHQPGSSPLNRSSS